MPSYFTLILFFFNCSFLPTGLYGQKGSVARKEQKEIRERIGLGEKLYNKYSCKSCHGEKGILEGDLTKAYKKFTDAQLRDFISNPRQFNNQKMPVYSTIIPSQDYPALIEYVKHLGRRAAIEKHEHLAEP